MPVISELSVLLRGVIGDRKSGPVFLRKKFNLSNPDALRETRAGLAREGAHRLERARGGGKLARRAEQRVLQAVWRDAGAVPEDRIRTCFIRAANAAGLSCTCPKSWRHTFATLMQEANVDLLVRQETLGHKPSSPDMSALGMTGAYTHTTPEFQRREIERAVRLRPETLALVKRSTQGENP